MNPAIVDSVADYRGWSENEVDDIIKDTNRWDNELVTISIL
ncbi:hypothetical protein RCG24_07675 [Neobacillus sp. OS1-32]|nr:hypothetical protein [Neobacillus sp. OS1-32]WML31723.1 hypothetical protein RCG24_07675 [Neobacillus sp. OS1-32]